MRNPPPLTHACSPLLVPAESWVGLPRLLIWSLGGSHPFLVLWGLHGLGAGLDGIWPLSVLEGPSGLPGPLYLYLCPGAAASAWLIGVHSSCQVCPGWLSKCIIEAIMETKMSFYSVRIH